MVSAGTSRRLHNSKAVVSYNCVIRCVTGWGKCVGAGRSGSIFAKGYGVAILDVLRAQRERRTDTALNTVSNSAKNCVLALPPDALLCVARCSAHAACAPDIMLKRYDVLQHVGLSR